MTTPTQSKAASVDAASNDPTSAASTEVSAEVGIINLPLGKQLSDEDAVKLAAERPVTLIVCAAPVDYGKTTLLTSLYELFQKGPVSGQRFAGSLTLPGFEERCHFARLASQNRRAGTQRTIYKPEADYLHLRTAAIEIPSHQTDFLFTDVSGEMFKHAINSEKECRELTFIERADHLLLFFDTSRALRSNKWAMLENSMTLLRSFLDHEMLPSACIVSIVWSKYDYFESAGDADRKAINEFRQEVESQFKTTFSDRVADLRFKEIAACPLEKPNWRLGKGVPELFAEWITGNAHLRTPDLQAQQISGERESEQFAMRHFTAESQL